MSTLTIKIAASGTIIDGNGKAVRRNNQRALRRI
jgi:hypothetical protein